MKMMPYLDDEAVDESLGLLYDDSPEEKIKGIGRVLSLARDDAAILEDVAENHVLMSALSRLLGESDSHPIELTFGIGKLFLSLSLIEDYHELLSSRRVGALVMDVIELELKRARHRGVVSDAPVDAGSVSSADQSIGLASQVHAFTTKQEQLLFVCLRLLDNQADDLPVLRKMLKKSLATLLVRCLNCGSIEFLSVTLSLLKKASVFEETAQELSSDGCQAISQLARLLAAPSIEIQHQVVAILFNLSFHAKCTSLISSEDVHPTLTSLMTEPSLGVETLQFVYHLSSEEADQQKLLDAGIVPVLVDLLQHTLANAELEGALAGLIGNISLHPLGCEEMIHLGALALLFRIIRKTQPDCTQQIVLKVLRNLSTWTRGLQCQIKKAFEIRDASPLDGIAKEPSFYISLVQDDEVEDGDAALSTASLYWEKHIWDSRVDSIVQHALSCENADLLVEWLGILSNLTRDDLPGGIQWHDILNENHYQSGTVQLFQKLLDPTCHEDLKLELVVWLGELCCSKECSYWIASNNLVDVLHTVFVEKEDKGTETRLQILLAYERLLLYEETRFQVVGGDGIMDTMLECMCIAGESNLVLNVTFVGVSYSSKTLIATNTVRNE